MDRRRYASSGDSAQELAQKASSNFEIFVTDMQVRFNWSEHDDALHALYKQVQYDSRKPQHFVLILQRIF